MKKPCKKKRQLLGAGYIWFQRRAASYDAVVLTEGPHGQGSVIAPKVGRLGGWQKVKLYAEYVPVRR